MSIATTQYSGLSFTTTFPVISDRLVNQTGIASSFAPDGTISKPNEPTKKYDALWDTGATCSCVSQRVVDELFLPVISKRRIKGATGVAAVKNVHVVNLFLPNNICIAGIQAVCADIISFDILIGMDIIKIGDLIISNYKGQTLFTFRCPSMHSYDFTKHDYFP